jgi:YfiH family protein
MADSCVYSEGGFRLERLANGWLVGRFAALEAVGVVHLVTTRQGPDVQQIRDNPAAAGRQMGPVLGLDDVAFLEQVHGGEALLCERPGRAGCADGLVTTTGGLALMGKSGDCPIVLLADRGRRAAGFAHASWRATVAGITPAVVRRMVDLGCEASDLVACICPSAGPECYEVGDEVRAAALHGIGPHAAAFFRPGPRGRDHFDLWQANADALARAGLDPSSIHVAGVCTLCRNDLFPSHRREGEAAGRFAAMIALSASRR